jgi:acyl carrier protein
VYKRQLQAHIQKTLAQVLRMAPERIEPKTPLGLLGLESLMSVEFRNRLEASLDLKLSATLVWSYPTLHDLTYFLMEKLGITPTAETPAATQKNIPQPALDQEEVVQKVKAMSDEDALQALKNRRKGK